MTSSAVASIVSYGVGNISSIANMFRHVGIATEVVTDAKQVLAANRLVLPGVGAFDHGMRCLRASGLADAVSEAVLERGVPILGICLGMQLMCRSSEEGQLPGLGWIDAEVRRFNFAEESGLKVPHMGWNTVTLRRRNSIIPADELKQRFYFVHSYYVRCMNAEDVVATTTYGHEFVSVFAHDNLYGVQFHPEKSHRYGMAIMRRFVEI